jgi:hypothetical protein
LAFCNKASTFSLESSTLYGLSAATPRATQAKAEIIAARFGTSRYHHKLLVSSSTNFITKGVLLYGLLANIAGGKFFMCPFRRPFSLLRGLFFFSKKLVILINRFFLISYLIARLFYEYPKRKRGNHRVYSAPYIVIRH